MRAEFPLLVLLLLFSALAGKAQNLYVKGAATESTPDHVFHLELGGTGYLYSLNYERKLLQRGFFCMFGRLGLEYLPIERADRMIHLPLGAAFTLGNKKSRAELGLAALFRIDFSPVGFGEGFYFTNPPTRIFLSPSVGWRFHAKPNEYGESFLLRVMFTPLIGMDVFDSMPYFMPHAGISVGRTWNSDRRKGKRK